MMRQKVADVSGMSFNLCPGCHKLHRVREIKRTNLSILIQLVSIVVAVNACFNNATVVGQIEIADKGDENTCPFRSGAVTMEQMNICE